MTTCTLALLLTAGIAGASLAQSTGAPAGRDPVTAPGGTTGAAGPRNEAEAIRSGDAIPVPPGAGGVRVPPSTATGTTPTERPTSRP
ncbi:MAG: hypothetical protein K2Y56_05620 [Methylobacterium sp.]|nr:hypothetical protein [Methylobacterium sp.]